MELAAIDGERKRKMRKEWTDHWKKNEQDARLIQQMQMAEKMAEKTTNKMEDLAYAKVVIDGARAEEEVKQQARQRQIEEKKRLAKERENEVALKRKLEADRKKEEADFDKADIAAKMAAFRAEQQKCRDMAMAETDLNVKRAYMQVVKQMDKQDTTVTWDTDIH